MSLNTDDLALLALGIQGDKPPDSDQPPLPDGIHLRWQPSQELGFPWHGFYLFRRETQPRRLCLSTALVGIRPGPTKSGTLQTHLGRLTSPEPLVFTDDFPAAGAVETDLPKGLRFDLSAGVEASQVEIQIGFRDTGPALERKCIDFRKLPLGRGPSPRIEQEWVFKTDAPPVSLGIAVTLVERWGTSLPGLNTSRRLEITLPRAASRVDLLLTNRHALRIDALNEQGGRVAVRELRPGELQAGSITLTGGGIIRVILEGSAFDAALLHEVCSESLRPGGGVARIVIRALAGSQVVAQTLAQGTTGQVVPASLSAGGITAIEIDPGNAALIDLCYRPAKQGVTFGWKAIPGFRYPLCLPVADPGYPCPGKPATFDDARALALSRINYPDLKDPRRWEDAFPHLHGQLALLVNRGTDGGLMKDRVLPELLGDPLGPAPDAEPFRLKDQSPLELVLLASLHPAIAQMLGLYFLDASAAPGVPYDYLLLADPTGMLGGSAASALLAFQAAPDAVTGCLVLAKVVAPALSLPAPEKARAYALPGTTTRAEDGTLNGAQSNVGLWWELPPPPPAGVTEEPILPVLYHPRRVSLGATEPTAPPPAAAYQALRDEESAVVVPELENPAPPPEPGETRSSPDWPPSTVPFHVVDSGLAEGWYSYRIVSQDLFGRHSAPSSPAEWYQWDPPAGQPPPWYYKKDAPGHRSIHAFAVALLDKVPPPPPTGIEADALDPLDRWVLQDGPYGEWRKENPDVVGLRVRWRWTLAHQNHAPDTREFRIYYVPGRLSELKEPPARIGLEELRRPATWAKRLHVASYADAVEKTLEISRDPQNRPLDDENFGKAGATTADRTAQLPSGVDLSGVQPWLDHLYLDGDAARSGKTYRVEEVKLSAGTLLLDGAPNLGGKASPWTIGRPVRLYEVFLPAPDVGVGEPFRPTLDHSAVFAQIGVSAADDKAHTGDDPKWTGQTWGGRFGNEGPVGGPAAIYRVLQARPDPPELADYPDKLLATPADYQSRSFFTFRWKPKAGLKTHVLRALDDSLFQVDREQRPRSDLDATRDAALFPPAWSPARREQIAAELNKLNQADADYETLSNDALRVLAGLLDNEDAFTQITLEPLTDTDSGIQDQRRPDDPADYTPNSAIRAYLDTLPGRATNRYFYRAAFVDGAQNRSDLSASTPPVYLPKVEPPRTPVITKVVGGNREIKIEWAAQQEADLLAYRVYRTEDGEMARDLRLMTRVAEVAAAGDVVWSDKTVVGLTDFYYRVVAIDSSGNESRPSPAVTARALDESPPAAVSWERVEWVKVNAAGDLVAWDTGSERDVPAVWLEWTVLDRNLAFLVQRRLTGASSWIPLTVWLKEARSFVDRDVSSKVRYEYRVIAANSIGRRSVSLPFLLSLPVS